MQLKTLKYEGIFKKRKKHFIFYQSFNSFHIKITSQISKSSIWPLGLQNSIDNSPTNVLNLASSL